MAVGRYWAWCKMAQRKITLSTQSCSYRPPAGTEAEKLWQQIQANHDQVMTALDSLERRTIDQVAELKRRDLEHDAMLSSMIKAEAGGYARTEAGKRAAIVAASLLAFVEVVRQIMTVVRS